jgi:hypothetical protein
MTEERFEEIVEDTLAQIRETILIKGKEYRRNKDPFHNFNQGAKLTGNTKYEVLDGFKLKHDISVQDIINDYKKMTFSSKSIINEKMNDILIYTIVKKAMMLGDTIKFKKVTV